MQECCRPARPEEGSQAYSSCFSETLLIVNKKSVAVLLFVQLDTALVDKTDNVILEPPQLHLSLNKWRGHFGANVNVVGQHLQWL